MTDVNHAVGKKILVAGASYWGYVKIIADGFISCGLKATALEWRTTKIDPVENIKLLTSKKYHIRWQEAQDVLNSHRLEEAVLSSEPDYVLVIKGARISTTLSRFCLRNNVTMALWVHDSAQHVPFVKEIVNDYDLVYFYEPTDLSLFPDTSHAKFLPLAYDPRYYYPIRGDIANPVDVCFIGSLGSLGFLSDYPTRKETIMKLARGFPNLVLEVSSGPRLSYSPFWIQDYLRFGNRGGLHFDRRSLSHAEINSIYGRSKICLNIHHAQTKKGVNSRTFEILGSGGFLLTDRRMEGLPDFEIGRDYEFYSSYDELFEKVTYYLQNPDLMKSIAYSGYERVRRNHTYSHRAKAILKDLERDT